MAVGDANRTVRTIRTFAAWAFGVVIAALIPFWVIKGTKPTGHVALWVLYGALIAAALIWLGATMWLRTRPQPTARPETTTPPPQQRIGLMNRPGGYSDVSRASFSDKLDIALHNEGEVDASQAQFGVPSKDEPEDEADR